MGGATSQIPSSEIPLYDFNQDGVVDDQDLMLAKEYMWGRRAYETCQAAIATPVTATIDLSNPARAIRYTGTNAWGRYVEEYAGTNFSTAVNPATEERIAALEERLASLEANLGGE
jgi:hypothetical protein